MKWFRRIFVAGACLLYALWVFWYIAVWMNGAEIRKFLAINAAMLCGVSILFFLLAFSARSRLSRLRRNFRAWYISWFSLGLGLALLLFAAERLLGLYISQIVLFLFWPGYLVLLVPTLRVEVLAILFLLFSMFSKRGAVYGVDFSHWWVSKSRDFPLKRRGKQ